jgi:hypothetical protein
MLTLPQIEGEIRKLEKQGFEGIIAIGGLLKQAKEQTEHGQFQDWIAAKFAWSYRTAVRYRAAYDFAQTCHSGIFDRCSVSGLHALAELDGDDEIEARVRDSIIASDQSITRSSVDRALMEEHHKEAVRLRRAAAKAAKASSKSKPPGKSKAAGKGDGDDDKEGGDAAKKAQELAKRYRINGLVRLLQQLMLYKPDDSLWADAIKDFGAGSLHTLIQTLQIVSRRQQGGVRASALKAAADRAEQRAKAWATSSMDKQ